MTDVANLVLGVDSRQVKEGTSALDDLAEAGGKAEKATSSLGVAYGAAIGAAAVAVWRHAVSSAMEAEQASAKLGAALNATGYAAGLTKKSLDEMADSMAFATKFDDESIRNASAVLLTFRNVQGETFEQGINLAADLASMLGTDLQSAALQVGKALNDPVHGITALSRAGVQFSEVQKDQIKHFVETNQLAKAQEIVLAELQGQLGGTAKAMNTGLTKETRDLSKAWDELYESIGKSDAVQKPTTAFYSSLTSYLKDMKSVIDDGDWLDRLAFFTVGYTTASIKAGKPAGDKTDEEALAELGAMGGAALQRQKQDDEAKYLAAKAAAEKAAKLAIEAAKERAKMLDIDLKGKVAAAEASVRESEEEQIALNKIDEERLAYSEMMRKKNLDGQVRMAEESARASDEEAKQLAKDQIKAAEDAAKEERKSWESVEKTAHDSFVNIYKGGHDVFQKLADTLENTLIEMLYQMTMKKWIINLETQITGAGGAGNFLSSLFGNMGSGGVVDTGTVTGADMMAAFDGGGFTGDGSRSGGLDGKGGFAAILHPQETVVDHTKGQSTGGTKIVYSPVINIDSRTDRADVMQLVSRAVQSGHAQLVDQLKRQRTI